MHSSLEDSAIQGFRSWSGIEPAEVAACPGRVNLIGEHVDYQFGRALPIAIDRQTVAAGVVSLSGQSEVFSSALEKSVVFGSDPPESSWARMVFGMRKLLGVPEHFRIFIHGDVPLGAGLSSSAALNLSVGSLMCGLVGREIDRYSLALLAQQCETEFGGTPCGLLDQIACIYSKEGYATLIDFKEPSCPRCVPFPSEIVVAVVDSGVRHENASSGYADRRRETGAAARVLGVENLREATMSALSALPEPLRRRALHVLTENERVLEFVEGFEGNGFKRLGEIMNEGHQSLRDNFEVSCPEMDVLVARCQQAPGAYGARMTGGGFGGSCVALVDTEKAGAFAAALKDLGHKVHFCTPSDGCRPLG